MMVERKKPSDRSSQSDGCAEGKYCEPALWKQTGQAQKGGARQRAVKPWTEQKDEQLKEAFPEGASFEQLAPEHQCTTGAIRSRLEKHRYIDRYGKRTAFKG